MADVETCWSCVHSLRDWFVPGSGGNGTEASIVVAARLLSPEGLLLVWQYVFARWSPQGAWSLVCFDFRVWGMYMNFPDIVWRSFQLPLVPVRTLSEVAASGVP